MCGKMKKGESINRCTIYKEAYVMEEVMLEIWLITLKLYYTEQCFFLTVHIDCVQETVALTILGYLVVELLKMG